MGGPLMYSFVSGGRKILSFTADNNANVMLIIESPICSVYACISLENLT